ncbi:hypothetical protein VZT92_005680 [Zoarces viviparus]|uniref:Uncharacterized protein n=1 Tax=Zoarces viviparus TaxID=48416 RepID=A0AAW1FV37_ZOAVI
MVMVTAPVAPFSCAASPTHPVGFRVRGPSANGPFLPHGQPPGYLSAPGSGASGGAELSPQEVSSQRMGV